MELQKLKGFRDVLPEDAKKREYVLNIFKQTFKEFGFDNIETPALEYESLLLGKYGDEADKLMYRFSDNGQRRVALRYDQTIPLMRVVHEHYASLPFPLKRFQIQPVWRADKPQKGRYREFIQCDADIVHSSSALADAEILSLVYTVYTKLGFSPTIIFNSRTVLYDLLKKAALPQDKWNIVLQAIDKLDKITPSEVDQLLEEKGLSQQFFTKTLHPLLEELNTTWTSTQGFPDASLQQIYQQAKALTIPDTALHFSPTTVRGLDYYTGMIFELRDERYKTGSLCGGGRYDNLIKDPQGNSLPCVGVGFGFDRMIDAMTDLGLFPSNLCHATSKVLVTLYSKGHETQSIKLVSLLRNSGIPTELYLGTIKENNPLEKQLKYADMKQIPFAVILGPDEIAHNKIILKDLTAHTQKELSPDELVKALV